MDNRAKQRQLMKKQREEKKEQAPQNQQQQEGSTKSFKQKALDWTKRQLLSVRPAFGYLLAFSLGSGFVWQYSQYIIQRENQAHDITKEMNIKQEKLLDIVDEVADLEKVKEEH